MSNDKPIEVPIKDTGERQEDLLARSLLEPAMQAAINIPSLVLMKDLELDVGSVRDELHAQCLAVAGGDLTRAESMLVAQAHTLDLLFNLMVRCSGRNIGKHLDATDRYMRLALKAQAQARATVETLAMLKNPTPTVFARQANVTSGPQQVNNGPVARAGNQESAPIEESGGPHELLQDTRAPAASFGNDSTLAAVGEVHRAAHSGRQGAIFNEPLSRRNS
jgi:hypothetical protein